MKNIQQSIDIRALTAFIEVAKEHSFKAAARHLGVTPSAVSKAINKLEVNLGVALLIRNSRMVSLTEEGQVFYDYSREVIESLGNARNAVTRSSKSLQGVVRVSVPVELGQALIAPRIPEFLERYPELQLQLILTNRRMSFGDDHIDVALWNGHIPDSRLVARSLGELTLQTCASVNYIEKFGMPNHPNDLINHQCLAVVSEKTGIIRPWKFLLDNKRMEHTPSEKLVSNNQMVLVTMAVADMGIIQVSDYLVTDLIEEGLLVPLFCKYTTADIPLHLVYQHANASTKVRRFIDFMVSLFN